MNLNDLYKKVSVIPIGDFPPSALSGLLHGYISIYSIVRVNPWLEDVYGSQWDLHERIREIAGELADLIKDPSVTLEDRVGHIADLMEAYLTYSDMDFLDIALDAAYGIISLEGSDEIVLPCRTPEICRLLCSCYYFTGEDECARLAKEIIIEWEDRVKNIYNDLEQPDMWELLRTVEFYENIIGEKRERELLGDMNLIGNNLLNDLKMGGQDLRCVSSYFDVLATKEYINLK